LNEAKIVRFQTSPTREINAVEITLHDILSAPSMIDRVAEEELTILYIMNAAQGIPSNYLEHAKSNL
jgi:hypothetical protein